MKNKKLLCLLIGLICIAVCTSVFLAACKNGDEDETPSETTRQEEPTEGQTTAPDVTNPDVTEPEATEPEVTEPEGTQPEETEPTEPEETQPTGGSSGPSVNTGTGGGYNPGTSDPTEPAPPTEPEIAVPAAGSETNAYSEYIKDPAGSFSTVSIPAGQAMYYRIKTPGAFLYIEDADLSVVYNGTTYEPVKGVIEIALPGDDSQAIALQFVNKSQDEKAFAAKVQDAFGSQTNPIVLDSIASIQASLDAGDEDGLYYKWTADQSGMLNIALNGENADAIITVAGKSVQLSTQGGQAQIPVNAGAEVNIQILANANEDGTIPGVQAQLTGYVSVIVDLTISEIPAEVETVSVPGKQSVIYRISGIRGKTLKIADSSFRVLFDGTTYTADESGLISIKIPAGGSKVELELFNDAEETKSTVFSVGYALGHELNPHILSQLGELPTSIPSDLNGYYYKYTAASAGMVTFQVWTYPEQENAVTNIVLTNNTTGESSTLWGENEAGESVDNGTVSLIVNDGDELTIYITVKTAGGFNLEADLVIYGELYGSEELPIQIAYPGFTAYVPAGETMYYEGYNLGGLIFTASGENMKIAHNDVEYTPADGKITFSVTASGRMPAVFAITNTGAENGAFEVIFTYPIGHSENPDQLLLGSNTLTQNAGATDYYYTFTAPRAGTITLTFDSAAQWLYTVDNLTQGIYGDTQWSDSDPLVAETSITVKARDVIQVRVNTYDTANMFETPAGTVVFAVKYVSGPTVISNLSTPVNTNLLPGEFGAYSGQFYDHVLTISGAQKLVVHFGGNAYYPNASGEIKLDFPASDGSGNQPNLEYIVENRDTTNVIRSMTFSTKNVGSMENPAPLQYGPNVMTQTQHNGADYYYTFTVTANGRFTITFDPNSNWIYQFKNLTRNQDSGIQVSSMGRNSYTLTVRKGDVLQLMVNTFDPATGGSPIGTVEFTVSPA